MRKRALGVVLAASTALVLVPSAGWADEVDTTCKNGSEPVHYQLTDGSPLVRIQLRVLCIRD
ncbi:MAG: hypothetical protein WD844_15395 [Thermoleophilaceae bacterium]